MSRVLAVLAVLALAIYCLVECIQTDRSQVRVLPKALWLFLILIPVVGPLAWLLLGRPRRGGGGAATQPATPRRAPAPRAPDDDPAFLAQLDERRRRAAREQARQDREDTTRGGARNEISGDAQHEAESDEDPEARGGSGS